MNIYSNNLSCTLEYRLSGNIFSVIDNVKGSDICILKNDGYYIIY